MVEGFLHILYMILFLFYFLFFFLLCKSKFIVTYWTEKRQSDQMCKYQNMGTVPTTKHVRASLPTVTLKMNTLISPR